MTTKSKRLSVVTFLVIGALWIILTHSVKQESVPKQPIIPPTPREFLKQEIERQGLTNRDYIIMTDIIQCESSWSQVWENSYGGHVKGEVKVSKANVGLTQINITAHQTEYEKLGLDPYDEFENITYGVMLYKRNGVRDWKNWSGHCWLPMLAEKGIYL